MTRRVSRSGRRLRSHLSTLHKLIFLSILCAAANGCAEDDGPTNTSQAPPDEPCDVEFVVSRSEGVSPDGQERVQISSSDVLAPDTVSSGWDVVFEWETNCIDPPEGFLRGDDEPLTVQYRLKTSGLGDFVIARATDQLRLTPDQLSSGAYSLEIEAIEEDGTKVSDQDYHFVWNRNPEVHFSRERKEGSSEEVEVFYVKIDPDGDESPENLISYCDGDTVPLVYPVNLVARVGASDPDGEPGIDGISELRARLVDDAGRWVALNRHDPVFSAENLTTDHEGYKLIAQARDQDGRWSRADTLRFHVNLAPGFITRGDIDGKPFVQRPLPGETLVVEEGAETIQLAFGANDPDRQREHFQFLEWRYRFPRFPLPSGQTGSEQFYSHWYLGDIDGRFFDLDANQDIAVERADREAFVAGAYTVEIQVREYRPRTEELLGKRISSRRVDFTLETR